MNGTFGYELDSEKLTEDEMLVPFIAAGTKKEPREKLSRRLFYIEIFALYRFRFRILSSCLRKTAQRCDLCFLRLSFGNIRLINEYIFIRIMLSHALRRYLCSFIQSEQTR